MSIRVDEPLNIEAPGEPVAVDAIKARGYWELVWIRFKRDKLAIASLGFIVFLFITAWGLAPLFQSLLGHGPNDIFADGVNQSTLIPVGPWTHITTAPYPGALQP